MYLSGTRITVGKKSMRDRDTIFMANGRERGDTIFMGRHSTLIWRIEVNYELINIINKVFFLIFYQVYKLK